MSYLDNAKFEAAIKAYKTTQQENARFGLLTEDIEASVDLRKLFGCQPPIHDLAWHQQARTKANADFKSAEAELITDFGLLCDNLIRKNRKIVLDVDDARQECLIRCFTHWLPKFVPDKGKAFNFFTTSIIRHLLQTWAISKKKQRFFNKYGQHLFQKGLLEGICLF